MGTPIELTIPARSWLEARRWLDTANQSLDGLAPEEVAKTPEGFTRVRQLLTSPTKAR